VRVFLIRHPRPAVAPGLCYGASDVDLAEDPAACAARLLECLPPRLRVFSSPLRRCRLLAQALHAEPVFDARLREMHFGRWELRAWDEIPRAELDAWAAAPLTYAPPGGESVNALLQRAGAFLEEHTRERDHDLAIVTHGGVMRALAGRLLGLAPESWTRLDFGYGELARLDLRKDGLADASASAGVLSGCTAGRPVLPSIACWKN